MMTSLSTSLSTPSADGGSAGLHILVVEDNLDSQQLVCELLGALGHHAEGVDSGEHALIALERHCFDVLFTDVNLPGMSGIELAQQMNVRVPALKIIFASGYGAQISKNVGNASFSLPKPYDIDQLQSILDVISRDLQRAGNLAH
ncbi:response regulator with CheY-like receiver, AAA-type ATPase, and DNA-binding domains [Herbaspirillum sp. CF444]|uniref:response regulator n=1 Tax=Herbaspirillum sp. CF444 TaxID=1144319 RepID=UPI00027283AF|nr:response regulator [Herbaspirillum sp. CF444]EJL90867.1 response regulator with CheY-like receiver, AAA-type ATPase, and DNA-binding domains [Herbaspirillum sp. CF444]